MKAPVRIVDDPRAPAVLRDDIAAAREAVEPFDAAIALERLRHGIRQSDTVPASGTSRLALGGGIGGVLVLALVAGLVVSREATTVPATPSVTAAPSATAKATSTAPTESVPASPSAPTVPLESLPSAPIVQATAAPSATAPKPGVPRSDRLREEMEQLARIRALGAAEPASALRLADEGHLRYRDGVLYEEREALAIEALVKLGRSSEAQKRGEAFLRRFPESPAAERVRTATSIGAP